MSTILILKQLLYQLKPEQIKASLSRYYSWKNESLDIQVTQKAYKCFESNVIIDDKKSVAGFGRNEDEATLNAARIALEGVIDSVTGEDLKALKRILEGDDTKIEEPQITQNDSELVQLLRELNLEEKADIFKREKIGVKELRRMNRRDLHDIGLSEKSAENVFWHFHPQAVRESNSELSKLKAENEKLRKLLNLDAPPRYLICPISHELMEDPVFTADGHTYERSAIDNWLRLHNTSPVTGLALAGKSLRPNYALRLAVQQYKEIVEAIQGKPYPKLTSDPCRDLYRTAYGHQFNDPFESPSQDDLRMMTLKAVNTVNGEFHLRLSPAKNICD
ncbi:unnamed protein product [Blepharisma stoltei]|uniref:U-box domain-containing protein n=1 Tax=Blepharisma stoltei TaxID=1481888 RepID=A0AAU9J8D4_9CILI|nr:unnamed protein product [Blepharisma stoltei]